MATRFGSAANTARPIAGVTAVIAAVAVGLAPTTSPVPRLAAASVTYLRGTKIGWTPTDDEYRAFIGRVLAGTDTPANPPESSGNVDYNAGFWPVSHNYIFDLTWNNSVAQGVANLSARNPDGDVIFGMSQGAVVASRYKAAHPDGTGNTFVLVENPSRPNGGVLSRFAGLYIPVLDVSFSGATPDNGDPTVDVARQYDGWADFPTYPLNLLATVNAVMGMIYVHGRTQTELTAADLEAAKAAGNDTMYYQERGNTTYYLIRTPRLPLLMPLNGIAPEAVLDTLDEVLRPLVEQGYDRTDYSTPTTAQLLPPLQPAATSAAAQQSVGRGAPTRAARALTRPTRNNSPARSASAPRAGEQSADSPRNHKRSGPNGAGPAKAARGR